MNQYSEDSPTDQLSALSIAAPDTDWNPYSALAVAANYSAVVLADRFSALATFTTTTTTTTTSTN